MRSPLGPRDRAGSRQGVGRGWVFHFQLSDWSKTWKPSEPFAKRLNQSFPQATRSFTSADVDDLAQWAQQKNVSTDFYPMPNHAAFTVFADRRQGVNRAFEAVKRVFLSGYNQIEGLVVFVSTYLTGRHALLLQWAVCPDSGVRMRTPVTVVRIGVRISASLYRARASQAGAFQICKGSGFGCYFR